MCALTDSLGQTAQYNLADFVLALPTQSDESVASALSQLVQRLPATVWNPERAQRAANRPSADNRQLTYALLGVAAP
jgi:hypothetical protein